MIVLAARIGCDNTGYVLVKEGSRVVRRRWSGPVPPPPYPWKSEGPDLIRIVNRAVSNVIYKYRIPMHMKDELTSGAQLSVSKALKTYDKNRHYYDSIDSYLMTAGKRGCVDAIRERIGRTGNEDLRNVRQPLALMMPDNATGELREIDIEDPRATEPYDRLVREDSMRLALAKISRPRDREIALRMADGATMLEVGQHFGISESRISQIAARIRLELVGEEKEVPETWEEEPEWNLVLGSWR